MQHYYFCVLSKKKLKNNIKNQKNQRRKKKYIKQIRYEFLVDKNE